MNIYIAASSDTNTKFSAYAYKVHAYTIMSESHNLSTTPKELLLALKHGLTDYIKEELYRRDSEIYIITNNEYIINMINEDKIPKWKRSSWLKDNGEEVANKDVLMGIYQCLMFLKEQKAVLFATKPQSAREIENFNAVAKASLAKRKES